jgi:glutamate/tyrosine decarboxylase-like PLP-dependent enzyme
MSTRSVIPADIERRSRSLDYSPNEWADAMKVLAEYGQRYLEANIDGPAFLPVTAVDSGSPVPPRQREPLVNVLREFDETALRSGITPTSGRFFGYIPGGGMPAAAIGDCIAALTNRYAGTYGASPGAVDIENQVVRWLRDLLNWPAESWGTLQSGGSLSTLTALVAARSTRPYEEWGRSVIYASEETHHCFQKACVIAGIEICPYRSIPIDAHGRISVDPLRQQIAADRAAGLSPWIVCATAGTTNLGAVDPLEDIAALCRGEDLWLHIDAAYGGFFWLIDEGKQRLKGLDLGDSIVLDPHKSLFQPYGLGIVLVKNASLLRKSVVNQAAYLRDLVRDHQSPMDYSPELTRHFRALRLWLSLKHHGLDAFEAALEEKLLLAEYAWGQLEAMDGIECFSKPELSVVAFRCQGESADQANAKTNRLRDFLLQRGRVHISTTEIRPYTYIRLCILSFRSHQAEVDQALEEIRLGMRG